MAFIDEIMAKAKADKKTIVLPESMDKRTFKAAEAILKEKIANIIIIGTPEEIAKNSEGFDITGAKIVDPFTDPDKQKYVDKFVVTGVNLAAKDVQDFFGLERVSETECIQHGTQVFGSDLLLAVAEGTFRSYVALNHQSVEPHVKCLLRKRLYQFALATHV